MNPTNPMGLNTANHGELDYVPVVAGWNPAAVRMAGLAALHQRRGAEVTYARPAGALWRPVPGSVGATTLIDGEHDHRLDPERDEAVRRLVRRQLLAMARRGISCLRLTPSDVVVTTDEPLTVELRGTVRAIRLDGHASRIRARRRISSLLLSLDAELGSARPSRQWRAPRLIPAGFSRRSAALVGGLALGLALTGAAVGVLSRGEPAGFPLETTKPQSPATDRSMMAGPATLEHGGVTYRIGVGGDRVAVGDWDGDGVPTPALFRPASSEIFEWDAWPADASPISAHTSRTLAGVRAVALSRCSVDDDRTVDCLVEVRS
jgi:hypothetical protein